MTMKNEPVLVLSKGWIPIHITTLRDAIGLVFVGGAKIVVTSDMTDRDDNKTAHEFETLDYDKWVEVSEKLDSDDFTMIHSSHKPHFKPTVIVRNWGGIQRYEIKFCRQSLYERDQGSCQYCGKKVGQKVATIDHIIPKSRGGKSTWKNTVISCDTCNTKKGDKNLENSNMSLLSEPRKPTWVAVKLNKAKTMQEKAEWLKFTGYV